MLWTSLCYHGGPSCAALERDESAACREQSYCQKSLLSDLWKMKCAQLVLHRHKAQANANGIGMMPEDEFRERGQVEDGGKPGDASDHLPGQEISPVGAHL